MIKTEKVFVFLMLAFLAVITACQRSNVPDVAHVETATPEKSPLVRPMWFVIDDLERKITVPNKITRVVSLAPSVTEIIFAAGGGERLVGVTTFCNYPEEAKSITKVGDTLNPNMETIVALKPDIVFVSTASQVEAFTKTLEQNEIAVYVMDPIFLDQIFESIRRLGGIFDTNEIATETSYRLELRRAEVCEKTDGCLGRDKDDRAPDAVPVFVQISKEPLFTVGKTSFLNEMIQDAGGSLVTAAIKAAFPKLSKETAAALNPEAIILSDSEDNQEPNEIFRNSPAVKNGRVYKIDADIISRPGPRLVDALEQIAKYLHPEKF